MPLSVCIFGASGKMGKALYLAAKNHPSIQITGAICSPGSPHEGKDLGILHEQAPCNLFLSSNYAQEMAKSDIIIDFSAKNHFFAVVQEALNQKKPLVCGTTGLTPKHFDLMQEAKKHIPILYSPNFSIGIFLMQKALSFITKGLDEASIEITEAHHTQKKDAPSGTAILLAKGIAKQMKTKRKIPICAIRKENIVGTHIAKFTASEEEITICHKAFSRKVFALGALKGAIFLSKKNAGLYDLEDLLS